MKGNIHRINTRIEERKTQQVFLIFSAKRLNFSLVARQVLKFIRWEKSLITHCKIRSLLIAEVAGCKKTPGTCCEIRSLLVATYHCVTRCRNCSLQNIICHSFNKVRGKFQISQYNLFPKAKNFQVVLSQRITLKSVVNRTLF